MNEQTLLRIIGEIDEAFIEAAAPTEAELGSMALAQADATAFTQLQEEIPQENQAPRRLHFAPEKHKSGKKAVAWQRYLTLAACGAVMLCAFGVYKTAIWGIRIESDSAPSVSTGAAPESSSTTAGTQNSEDVQTQEENPDYITRGEEDEALIDTALAAQNAEALADYELQAPYQYTETAADGLLLLTPSIAVGGMGYEGVIAYDFSEYINENPGWACLSYETLPVYFTAYSYYPDQYPEFMAQVLPIDTEAVTARLETLAVIFGLDASTPVTDNGLSQAGIAGRIASYLEAYQSGELAGIPNLFPTEYELQDGNVSITLSFGCASERISFETAVPLQNTYSAADYESEIDRLTAIGEELIATYADYLDMQDPQVEITGLDYNIYGEQYFYIQIYEGAGSQQEALLNYHFNRVGFYLDDNDALTTIYRNTYDLTDKAGDYPVLSVAEATEQLQSGNYISTVSEDCLLEDGLNNIAGVEIVYRKGIFESSYLPYYRFWIEIEQGNDNAASLGLKNYGAYYVPAVQSEYITEDLLWDGEFN